MDERIKQLAEEIHTVERCVAFTGAGVSRASGIPDFRSEDGIWRDYNTERFHIREFRRDPDEFWDRMLSVYEKAFEGSHEPNVAHRALATLEQRGHLEAVITQNADRLHQAAGSEEVVELHGPSNVWSARPAGPANRSKTPGSGPKPASCLQSATIVESR